MISVTTKGLILYFYGYLMMRYTLLGAALLALALSGCGKPTAPDSPDPSTYGKVITPDHHVPKEHQDSDEKT
jgi:hypothetical protein